MQDCEGTGIYDPVESSIDFLTKKAIREDDLFFSLIHNNKF